MRALVAEHSRHNADAMCSAQQKCPQPPLAKAEQKQERGNCHHEQRRPRPLLHRTSRQKRESIVRATRVLTDARAASKLIYRDYSELWIDHVPDHA
jgi:hypothetical protein